jgi:hypothetical protein
MMEPLSRHTTAFDYSGDGEGKGKIWEKVLDDALGKSVGTEGRKEKL